MKKGKGKVSGRVEEITRRRNQQMTPGKEWSPDYIWSYLMVNLWKRSSFRNEGWPGTSESFSEANRQSRNSQHSLSLVSTLGILPPGTEERNNSLAIGKIQRSFETNECDQASVGIKKIKKKKCQQINAWSRECWSSFSFFSFMRSIK